MCLCQPFRLCHQVFPVGRNDNHIRSSQRVQILICNIPYRFYRIKARSFRSDGYELTQFSCGNGKRICAAYKAAFHPANICGIGDIPHNSRSCGTGKYKCRLFIDGGQRTESKVRSIQRKRADIVQSNIIQAPRCPGRAGMDNGHYSILRLCTQPGSTYGGRSSSSVILIVGRYGCQCSISSHLTIHCNRIIGRCSNGTGSKNCGQPYRIFRNDTRQTQRIILGVTRRIIIIFI